MSGTRITRRDANLRLVREASGYGVLNLGYAIEHDAKAEAPVAGGHRSFHQGQPPVGGNLRRSLHTEGYLDGHRISGETTDENGRALPNYGSRPGIWVFIGTNCGYGWYVEEGTWKMAGRPFVRPAALMNIANGGELIRAGASRHFAGRAR